jgi:hypothetical protein
MFLVLSSHYIILYDRVISVLGRPYVEIPWYWYILYDYSRLSWYSMYALLCLLVPSVDKWESRTDALSNCVPYKVESSDVRRLDANRLSSCPGST